MRAYTTPHHVLANGLEFLRQSQRWSWRSIHLSNQASRPFVRVSALALTRIATFPNDHDVLRTLECSRERQYLRVLRARSRSSPIQRWGKQPDQSDFRAV
jgi:hypothetical protein